MFELLSLISAFILTALSTGSEKALKKVEHVRQYFQPSSTKAKITAEQEFKIHLIQGNYQHCIDLIQKARTTPTQEHFDMATKLASIESNPNTQKNALSCARFIYHDLVDRKIIMPEKNSTRGIEQILAELQRDATTIQGLFLRAIQENDIPRISFCLSHGAQPDLSSNYMKPAEIAIARGNKEALAVLYEIGVRPTPEHLEQAKIQHFLWTSNMAEPRSDILFTQTTREQGYAQALRKYQSLCDFITSNLPPETATNSQ